MSIQLSKITRVIWLLVGCSPAFLPATLLAQLPGDQDVAEVRALNQSLTAALANVQGGVPDPNVVAAIQQLLDRRRQTLTRVIQSSPKAALQLMFAAEQIRGFRSLAGVAVDSAESPDTVRGTASVMVADSPSTGRAIYMIEMGAGAGRVTTYLENPPTFEARCNQILAVSGYRLGQTMAGTYLKVEQAVTSTCSPLGVQNVAVLLVKAPGVATPAVTNAQIQDAIFGTTGDTVNNFFVENSYGLTSLTGSVFGWFTLDRTYACNELGAIVASAIAAADSTVDLRNYQRLVVISAASPCAVGYLGCLTLNSPLYGPFTASAVWAGLQSFDVPGLSTTKRTINHEFGHNLELMHSRSLKYSDRPLGPDRLLAQSGEYGDDYSTMGGLRGHYPASQKLLLGWLPSSSVQTVTASGTYTVAPLESASPSTRALKIKRNLHSNEYLWVEYRQNTGTVDSQFPAGSASVYSGALIHYEDSSPVNTTDLLDFVPATTGFYDAALPSGTWIDPHSDLRIEVALATSTGLTVNVTYDSLCATYAAPTAVFSAAAQQVPISVIAAPTCFWNAIGANYWVGAAPAAQTGSATVTMALAQNADPLARSGSISIGHQTSFFQQGGSPQAPAIVFASPNQGTIPTGLVPMDLYLRDLNGYADLGELDIQFGASQATANTCYIKYDFVAKKFSLMNDAGTGFLADQMNLGEWRTISNSQCAAGFFIAPNYSPTDLRFSFRVSFTQPTPADLNFYAMLQDITGASTGWTNQGMLTLSSATCLQTVSPGEAIVGPQSGNTASAVQSGATCSWTATSDSAWLQPLTAAATGNANAPIHYDAFSGSGTRTGKIQFGSATFTVVQSATPPVDVLYSPSEASYLASSGTGAVIVKVSPAGYTWTAASSAPSWITLTGSTTFTGQGYVYYSVAANTGPARQAYITLADGRIFVIRQEGAPVPDLVIAKTHSGTFRQGLGAAYAITVTNIGAGPTTGAVTVVDSLPAGLTATGIAGSGWSCTAPSGPCTRSDALAAGASYSPITLTVAVAASAPASVVNTAAVSGGGDATTGNNTAADVTAIQKVPDLKITLTHAGNFTQGQTGAAYTITVTNLGGPTGGSVRVFANAPTGLTPAGMSGSGWTCVPFGTICSRFDSVAEGTSYPPITLLVNVAANAPATLTNSALVETALDLNASNDTAYDLTTIQQQSPDLTITKAHSGTFYVGQTGVYAITVRNSGIALPTSGTVTVSDTLPGGLTGAGISGSGWTCTQPAGPCTRSDALAAGASYPVIMYTVNVASSAPSVVTNTATVSGGGETNSANNTATDITNVQSGIGQVALQLITVSPCRVIDTRLPTGPLGGPSLAGGGARSIPVPASNCGIPAAAVAYSLNITVVPKSGSLGYLTVWPAGQPQPNVSTINSPDGSILANAAIVPAGGGGAISAFATDSADLIIDINGYFRPPSANSLQFFPLTPCRVLDTRNTTGTFGGPAIPGTGSRSFPFPSSSCNIPSNAAAYSLNVTAVPQGSLGYLTAYPSGGSVPFVSTLNSLDGTILANAAIVPAGSNGAVSFYATNTTHLVVDINGYFAPSASSGRNFFVTTPCRLVDTRNANSPLGGPMLNGLSARTFPLPTSSCGLPSPAAYSLNVTVVPSGRLGYLTIWPTGQLQPYVSTLNAGKGLVVANAALVPAGTNGSVDVFVLSGTHVVIDVNGYFQ
jgi:M6 family metalloprotease-like protein/uncharacterized repeat protein (TIGR01451 family)